MPAPETLMPRRLPRVTSQALAMRPETRRLFVLVAVGAIVTATALGAAVAFLGDRLAGFSTGTAWIAATWGAVGAFVASILGAMALPVARRLLIARADVQLVEAASPLHPLLKRLMTEAPGTYAHSLATASLAEAGAEALGADPLVARVGAYYHDIGKIRQPCFFFENLGDEANPHDVTKPALSALIISAHVNDGMELAEEYDLPLRIRDIIREHHGTSLIRYFYYKAAEVEPGLGEGDFRYHGGVPRTREAAIVMLADGCEASVRALKNFGFSEVEDTVRGVIAEKDEDGQLAESGLTDAEVEVLAETFIRLLVSMMHARCEYPRFQHSPKGE